MTADANWRDPDRAVCGRNCAVPGAGSRWLLPAGGLSGDDDQRADVSNLPRPSQVAAAAVPHPDCLEAVLFYLAPYHRGHFRPRTGCSSAPVGRLRAFHQHSVARRVDDGPCRDAEKTGGRGDRTARGHSQAFSAEVGAERIIGWVRENNRAVLAMSRRVGFESMAGCPSRCRSPC